MSSPSERTSTRPVSEDSVLHRFFPTRVTQWLGVAAALGALAGTGGLLTVASGLANVSAVSPDLESVAHLLHFASARSFAVHGHPAPSVEPLDSPAMILRGATAYAGECQSCHGAPGLGQSPIALSTRPEPPVISVATDGLSDGELFFAIQNGVRFTGMPAWPVLNRPDEVWALVAFLKAARGMDGAAYERLSRGDPADIRKATLEGAGPLAHATGSLDAAGHGGPMAFAPFVASKSERPYLPGDPQTFFPSTLATISPRANFSRSDLGASGLAACVSCHGLDGAGRAGGAFPNLTLQAPQYLYDALKAFASGQRQSGIMWPIAAALTDEEMRALASQLGTSPPVAVPSAAPSAARVAGDAIAQGGVDGAAATAGAKRVERCTSCHRATVGLDRVIPRLAGQNAAYLRMQLHAFRNGGRGDTSSYDPMVPTSHALDDAEIAEVAAYYASREPVPKN